MSCQILGDFERQAFYCSTTMTAFGPIMYGDAEEFEEWLGTDPRTLDDNQLETKYNEFRRIKNND